MNKYLDIFREFSPDNIIFNTLNDFVPINNGDQDTSKLPKDTASIVDEIIENFDDKNNIKHECLGCNDLDRINKITFPIRAIGKNGHNNKIITVPGVLA